MSIVISNFLQTDATGKIHDLVSIPSYINDRINELEFALEREKNILGDLKSEVIEVIRGTSAFGSVLLNDLITKSECRIVELENEIVIQYDKLRKQKFQIDKFREIYKQIDFDRSTVYTSSSFDVQKATAHQLVERLYLGRGYKYRIEWKFGGYTQGEPDIEPD